jgi:selenocysteine-specific elongation factor
MSERHLIIGTAGHVDHGKTSLIKALTAIDCDTHKEEKERGITINLGFSHLELEDGTGVGIIDVPGHKDFIKTMVSGAHGIDLVLLVISADSGVMPQTKEHLNIIQMLDVQNGIVVLTKTDLVDEEMLELAQLEIEEYLEDTILSGAPVIPVSCMEGTGIPELRNVIENQLKRVSRMKSKEHFRMFVDRFFNVKGIGIVVTGSVLGGEVGEGDELYVLPDKTQKIKVKGVQRHGKKVSKIFAGDRAAINISGLSMDDYYRGMLLSSSDISPQGIIDARISLFQENSTLKVWSHAILLCGTYESRVRIHLLDRDKLEPPDDALVQIHLEQAFTFSKKDRFILRNTSNDLTIGGGSCF